MRIIVPAVLFGLCVLAFARYVLGVRPSLRDASLIALGGLGVLAFAVLYQTPDVAFDSSKGDYSDKKLVLVSIATLACGLGAAVLGFASEAYGKK